MTNTDLMEMLAPGSAPGRYVIEAEAGDALDAVEAAAAAALGFENAAAAQAAGVHVEPLFGRPESGDPAFQLARYFVLTLPGDAPTQAGRFDLAYELRERGGFARVDPDVEISLVVPAADETAPGVAFELGRTDPTGSEPAWCLAWPQSHCTSGRSRAAWPRSLFHSQRRPLETRW